MAFTPKVWQNGLTLDATGLVDLETRLSAYTDTVGGGGGTDIRTLSVTANGSTNVAGTIQTLLTSLASSHSRSFEVIVEPAFPTTNPVIFLNGHVQITTSNTRVRFAAPLLLGTTSDPDGQGCLSILGSVAGTTTVSSGATRGSSVVVVASATSIVAGMMIKINDNDATGGGSAGWKQEVGEVLEVSGTSIFLSKPLHNTYAGTVTFSRLTPVTNSGFEDAYCTFTGQQAEDFLFPAKSQYARYCYFRNCHFKGTAADSWSREALNLRDSYRCIVDQCTASFSWDFNVGSDYSYGFSADGAIDCVYRACQANNLRHGFSLDKGSAGIIYHQCHSENSLASGFDLHGNWVTDILYNGCVATGSPNGREAQDGIHYGFLSGNSTFLNGVSYVTYSGCVARGLAPYTVNPSGLGEAAGFGIVDGSSNVIIQGCRVYDSQQGVLVLSEDGNLITNVAILDCEFNNIVSSDATNRPPAPIYVNAGIAPDDVNGLVIDGNKFINCTTSAGQIVVHGTSTNTLADIVISNNIFNRSIGVTASYAIEARFLTGLIIKGNIFNATRRGIIMQTCVGALINDNVFNNLTETNRVIDDQGGSTGFVFTKNVINPVPTSLAVTPTSTTPIIEISAPGGIATITYSASMTPNAAAGEYQKITPTNTTAMTVNAPTNAFAGRNLTLDFLNSSGGTMGVVTLNGVFKPAGAFVNPASTKHRTITFVFDGTSWIETNRAAADI